MNLLYKASINKLKAEFASNIQPGENRQDFNADNQTERYGKTERYGRTDQDKKQLESYRKYRQSKKQEDKQSNKKDFFRYTPLLPERLKKELKRQRNIKQDDISPTVS